MMQQACFTIPTLLGLAALTVTLSTAGTAALVYIAWRLGPVLDRDEDEAG